MMMMRPGDVIVRSMSKHPQVVNVYGGRAVARMRACHGGANCEKTMRWRWP